MQNLAITMRETPSANFREYPVTDELQGFVKRFVHSWSTNRHGQWLRIPPTGGMYLIFVRGSQVWIKFSGHIFRVKSRFYVGGQLNREQPDVHSAGPLELVGAEFTPTGFYKLFKRNVWRYTDTAVDFDSITSESGQLENDMTRAAGATDAIQAMQSWLLDLSASAWSANRAEAVVKQIVRDNGIVRVSALAKAHGYTVGQLRNQFMKQVGIPPKRLAKIIQLNTVIKVLSENDQLLLSELAQDHGYYDQAHFIRDFQQHVQTNPGTFLQGGYAFLRTFLGASTN